MVDSAIKTVIGHLVTYILGTNICAKQMHKTKGSWPKLMYCTSSLGQTYADFATQYRYTANFDQKQICPANETL